MLRIELGNIGEAFFQNNENGNLLTINTGTTLNIIQDYAVLRPDLGMNILGLHTPVQIAPGENVFKWGKFEASKHVARKRDNSCTWQPGGGTRVGVQSANVCNKQHQSEFCIGEIWDTCWEKLLGMGNDVEDIAATAEGSRFLNKLISKEMETIGNDYYDLAYFANHPNIELSESEGYWAANNTNAKEWNNFYTMSTDDQCGGFLTQCEDMRTNEALPNFNLNIADNEVDGNLYIGDTYDLFRRALALRPATFKVWSKSRFDSPIATPIISVSPSIFNRYKEQLTQTYNQIPEGFYLFINGENGIKMPMADILRFDGYWILSRPDWETLDSITGIISHVIALTAPGVFGIGYDVAPLKQFKGMGLVVNSWNAAPMLGTTYFHTNYKLGTMILDTDYVVYGRKFLVPENV